MQSVLLRVGSGQSVESNLFGHEKEQKQTNKKKYSKNHVFHFCTAIYLEDFLRN